ncbi:GNAT family N-acetyltransferase [Magnetospirillum sp. UT-4]|uniref:lipid II:glycine glycyltransferase FemX n=1 Tax=Magnetospirillum sp. UT-4 TaxID=2681467 RepID=UPI0013845A58|nr:GNAT family N-acetyltransferase [Magnetospirillum sp. UT-4]CAA7621700.1 conserved hypothetical protein [Magnetospirillum sp. UT-4]
MTATLDWIDNRDAYQAMLFEAGRSALLQDWAWGEAKAESEGWRPRRAVIAVGTVAVAVAQVLEKRIGPVCIARLNRGPVWFDDDLSVEDRIAALAALRRPWRWFRAGALLAAPEVAAGDAALLRAAGYRPRRGPAWSSAWLDLARDEAALRKGLAGKWRNMLVNAEKAGLEVAVTEGPAGLDWLLPHYREMAADKGFEALPPGLLAALARHGDADQLLTLIARAEGEPASAVLLARHGAAATYLIGWNGDSGRRLRGNHLLLWRSLLELKERGCRWFDLGGMDDRLTPGVAAFKRGLGGDEFTLAGEWVAVL